MAMTPKEKAEELVNKIKDDLFNKRAVKITDEDAALCALIAVDKIIEALEEHQWQNRHVIDDYKLVKQELENYE
jgi:hypothetical protein